MGARYLALPSGRGVTLVTSLSSFFMFMALRRLVGFWAMSLPLFLPFFQRTRSGLEMKNMSKISDEFRICPRNLPAA